VSRGSGNGSFLSVTPKRVVPEPPDRPTSGQSQEGPLVTRVGSRDSCPSPRMSSSLIHISRSHSRIMPEPQGHSLRIETPGDSVVQLDHMSSVSAHLPSRRSASFTRHSSRVMPWSTQHEDINLDMQVLHSSEEESALRQNPVFLNACITHVVPTEPESSSELLKQAVRNSLDITQRDRADLVSPTSPSSRGGRSSPLRSVSFNSGFQPASSTQHQQHQQQSRLSLEANHTPVDPGCSPSPQRAHAPAVRDTASGDRSPVRCGDHADSLPYPPSPPRTPTHSTSHHQLPKAALPVRMSASFTSSERRSNVPGAAHTAFRWHRVGSTWQRIPAGPGQGQEYGLQPEQGGGCLATPADAARMAALQLQGRGHAAAAPGTPVSAGPGPRSLAGPGSAVHHSDALSRPVAHVYSSRPAKHTPSSPLGGKSWSASSHEEGAGSSDPARPAASRGPVGQTLYAAGNARASSINSGTAAMSGAGSGAGPSTARSSTIGPATPGSGIGRGVTSRDAEALDAHSAPAAAAPSTSDCAPKPATRPGSMLQKLKGRFSTMFS